MSEPHSTASARPDKPANRPAKRLVRITATSPGSMTFASSLVTKLAQVPGMVDLRVHQAFNQPLLHLDVDRTRAVQTGFTQRDVANNLLISLSGSAQVTPTFWLNPATGVSYTIATQTPQYKVDSLQELGSIPLVG